jgi:hypothetical protein
MGQGRLFARLAEADRVTIIPAPAGRRTRAPGAGDGPSAKLGIGQIRLAFTTSCSRGRRCGRRGRGISSSFPGPFRRASGLGTVAPVSWTETTGLSAD